MAAAIFICHIELTAKPLAHAHSTYEVSQMTEDAAPWTAHPSLCLWPPPSRLFPSTPLPLSARSLLICCHFSQQLGAPMGQIQL